MIGLEIKKLENSKGFKIRKGRMRVENNFNQLVNSGISTLKYLVGQYGNDYELVGRINKERILRHMDILITVYGDEQTDEEFKNYKHEKGLEGYAVNQEYTQDKVYGAIKEFEFLKETIGELNRTDDYGALHNGLGNLLELYSEIFNNWKNYEEIFKNKAYDAVTDDAPTENSVKEFDYDELVSSGGKPNYTEDSVEDEEPEEPKTRVERRRKRRTR